ncbi:hypothetical protein [Gordonia sputi]|uniref:hypothetical protein n=1 Tax=Gordonia sputi TaxID=36823 RepID=UPI0020432DD1|nr:hypothetical protein [Gordonia sputi]MCM3897574.1 hypothetical protein [Gordonia sputi]
MTPARRVRRFVVLVVGLLLLTATGCATSTDQHPATSSPTPALTAADYPIRWLPTPNLDLTSPDGTFVRGIAETYLHARLLGDPGLTPGFTDAMRPALDFDLMRKKFGTLKTDHEPPETIYLFAAPFPYDHLADHPTDIGQGHTLGPNMSAAAICIAGPHPPATDHALFFFTYRRTGKPPPAHQHGPLAAPTTNIFGNWTGVDWIDTIVQITDRCNHPPTTIPTNPGLQPPNPGWPNSAQ